jgi:hypothetical protein
MAENLPPSSPDVTESRSLNLPETSGPHRPGMGLLYILFRYIYIYIYIYEYTYTNIDIYRVAQKEYTLIHQIFGICVYIFLGHSVYICTYESINE